MLRIVVCLFFIITISFSKSDEKQILLLHSYNDGLKWTTNITRGIEAVLEKYSKYELVIEYMDSKKFAGKEYFEDLEKIYKKKFSKIKFDVIVTADNYALEFAIKNHKELFKSSPIVFCGLENLTKLIIPPQSEKLVTGVVEYKQIEENIKLINKVMPNLNNLYIISDNSHSSGAIRNQIIKATKKYHNKYKIIFNDKINLKTIVNEINLLGPNSAVLYTSLYKDKNGDFVPYYKTKELFGKIKYPIFVVNKMHIGKGVLGGKVVDPYEQGFLAAEMAIKILRGKDIKKFAIQIPDSKYYFDYNIFAKYALVITRIPKESIVINRPLTFFQKYRKFIDSAFLLMPFLIFLIIGLIVNIARRFKVEKKLYEQNLLDNVLLNNIEDFVYWQSNDGVLLGCNDSLCKMLKLKKENIIGNKMKDLFPPLYKKIKDFDRIFRESWEIKLNVNKAPKEFYIRKRKYHNQRGKEAGMVIIVSDVTKVRKMELQRKNSEQLLVQRSKLTEIGEMIASIAHQWKSPLIEISTITQELLYIKNKNSFSKENIKKFVDEIMTQVQYMTKTVDDFRDFIKPSKRKEIFYILPSIKKLLEVVDHNIKFNYIKINIKYNEKTDLKIYGFENEFQQVVLNIVNNSKDAILKNRETEGFYEGLIEVVIKKKISGVYIHIIDNGTGIKKEHLKKIFDPFFTYNKDKGDGFGMYMAKLIIENKMNGRIRAIQNNKGAHLLLYFKF